MSLRAKLLLYLAVVHLALASVALALLLEYPYWLALIEALFVLSAVLGLRLVRALFEPLDRIRSGAELIRERDFTSHFVEVGQPEMDGLIRVYNLMIDRLREERLRLQEQHYFLEKILAASPSGILILDFDGRASFVNPSASKILMVSSEEILGRRLSEIISPVTASLRTLAPGGSHALPLMADRRLLASRAQFLDQGFTRDFFVLEELTDQLRATEKAAYEQLIRMMSHEINNSVGAVTSLLDSCLNYASQLTEEDRTDFRTAIGVAAARMQRLNAFMRGFAEVVRLPAPDPRPCDLRALLDDVLLLLRPESERRRIVFEWALAQTVPPIPIDKNQIEQVLVNVLRNAMESIEEDGGITLTLGIDQGRPYLSVRDTGRGIPAGVRERLFTPFFSTKKDGQGVGLTVVREVLTQHRFGFSLEGCEGGGADFRIQFG